MKNYSTKKKNAKNEKTINTKIKNYNIKMLKNKTRSNKTSNKKTIKVQKGGDGFLCYQSDQSQINESNPYTSYISNTYQTLDCLKNKLPEHCKKGLVFKYDYLIILFYLLYYNYFDKNEVEHIIKNIKIFTENNKKLNNILSKAKTYLFGILANTHIIENSLHNHEEVIQVYNENPELIEVYNNEKNYKFYQWIEKYYYFLYDNILKDKNDDIKYNDLKSNQHFLLDLLKSFPNYSAHAHTENNTFNFTKTTFNNNNTYISATNEYSLPDEIISDLPEFLNSIVKYILNPKKNLKSSVTVSPLPKTENIYSNIMTVKQKQILSVLKTKLSKNITLYNKYVYFDVKIILFYLLYYDYFEEHEIQNIKQMLSSDITNNEDDNLHKMRSLFEKLDIFDNSKIITLYNRNPNITFYDWIENHYGFLYKELLTNKGKDNELKIQFLFDLLKSFVVDKGNPHIFQFNKYEKPENLYSTLNKNLYSTLNNNNNNENNEDNNTQPKYDYNLNIEIIRKLPKKLHSTIITIQKNKNINTSLIEPTPTSAPNLPNFPQKTTLKPLPTPSNPIYGALYCGTIDNDPNISDYNKNKTQEQLNILNCFKTKVKEYIPDIQSNTEGKMIFHIHPYDTKIILYYLLYFNYFSKEEKEKVIKMINLRNKIHTVKNNINTQTKHRDLTTEIKKLLKNIFNKENEEEIKINKKRHYKLKIQNNKKVKVKANFYDWIDKYYPFLYIDIFEHNKNNKNNKNKDNTKLQKQFVFDLLNSFRFGSDGEIESFNFIKTLNDEPEGIYEIIPEYNLSKDIDKLLPKRMKDLIYYNNK